MKKILVLPVVLVSLAGAACSPTSGSQQVAPTDPSCYNLTGAALVECQRNVAPAAEVKEKPFKMVKPQKGAGGMRGSMAN